MRFGSDMFKFDFYFISSFQLLLANYKRTVNNNKTTIHIN